MKKYRYIIIDPAAGDVSFTNDFEVAKDFSKKDQYWVVDTNYTDLLYDGKVGTIPIVEATLG